MTDVAPPFHQQQSDLDDEAMKGSDLLENLMAEARRKNAENPETNKEPVRRGRGRPVGSRNATSTTRVSPPPTRPRPNTPPVDPASLTAAEKAQAISARASELSDKISEGINETIMLGLTSIGVPTALLYKPGQEPAMAMESEKYTDLAKGLLVSPNQARFWARFLAELEGTEQGKSFTNATGTGKGPLVIYGALSLLTVIQYAQNAKDTFANLKPYMDQYAAMQAQMAQQASEMRQQAEANAAQQNAQQ